MTRKNNAIRTDASEANGSAPDPLLGHVLTSETRSPHSRSIAGKLYQDNQTLRADLEHVRELQTQIRAEMETLLEPEQHSVVITAVDRNASLRAEVAGAGASRSWVSIHPYVDPATLRIGARGILTRARNCLLHIDSRPAEWRDVGTFERSLDDRRILVRSQQQLIMLNRADCLCGVELRPGDSIGFDREWGAIAYERLAPPDHQSLFADAVPDDDFSILGGLDAQIHEIQNVIRFCFQHPEIAAKYRLGRKRAILLIGPPGTGKSRVARCCAGHVKRLLPTAKVRFMCAEASSDYSVWFGDSEAKIQQRFAAIRDASREGPVIAFFDEIDALGRRRGTDFGSSAPDRILNTFLCQLASLQDCKNVLVLAATNRADVLDSALTRAGRFDLKIEFPNPNRRGAREILRHYLDGLPVCDPGIDAIVEAALGRLFSPRSAGSEVLQVKLADNRQLAVPAKAFVTGAMLENCVKVAAERAAKRELAGGEPGIQETDLLDAMEREIRGTVSMLSPDNVKAYVSSIPADARPVALTVVHRPDTLEYSRRGA